MKKTCDICGGSGQLSFFKGVSRFHLSVEECDVCSGIGYIVADDEEKKTVREKKKKTKKPIKN